MTYPLTPPDPRNPKKKTSKKLDRAAQKGSTVVFTNTNESKAFLALTIEADKLFRALRGGTDVVMMADHIKNSHSVICGLSDFLADLSREVGHAYTEPAVVTEIKRVSKK